MWAQNIEEKVRFEIQLSTTFIDVVIERIILSKRGDLFGLDI